MPREFRYEEPQGAERIEGGGIGRVESGEALLDEGTLGAISTGIGGGELGSLIGAWVSPFPRVVNVAPRVFWKTMNGVIAVVPLVAHSPSQLISRWPVAAGPLLPLSGLPRAARNEFTVSRMSAVAGPQSVNRMGAANAKHWRPVHRAAPCPRWGRVSVFGPHGNRRDQCRRTTRRPI